MTQKGARPSTRPRRVRDETEVVLNQRTVPSEQVVDVAGSVSFSAARLTLYALISAIETDLRSMILTQLGQQMTPAELLNEDLLERALIRLARDDAVDQRSPDLNQLLSYLDLGDLYPLLNSHTKALPNQIASYIKKRTTDLDLLIPIRNRVAHSRPLNIDDFATVFDLAEHLVSESPEYWSDLAAVLKRLHLEPSFVLGLEIRTHSDDPAKARHNLPTPDFDETGFVGRAAEIEQLVKLCQGPFPVISVLAEGGVGKTALAHKVAYELLDDPKNPFDAIVWTSAKTAHLTPNQIQNIEGAIRTSLGMLEAVATELAGTSDADPLEEVLDYLREFKILLILDNLETVLDDYVRGFLERLPSGSKVLITSRIGLGALEFPIKLEPLTSGESVDLLRTLARVRGVPHLVKMPNDRLATYCERMQNNPGFIKWFVSAVQARGRPEEILAKSGLFLDYCLSNVYNYLTDVARTVLEAMVVVPTQLSQAELAYITQYEPRTLQEGLQELLTTNMVAMNSVARGSALYESYYRISDLARAYLLKHHPIVPQRAEALRRSSRQLAASGQALEAEQRSAERYSIGALTISTRGQRAVARYVVDALRELRIRRFERAEALLATAMALAPGYSEVHRVHALLRAMEGNVLEARADYECAIELNPTSAPLHFWFGGFLLRYENDFEAALREFQSAHSLDPAAPEPVLEIARVRLWSEEWADARELIDDLKGRRDLDIAVRRRTADLDTQFHRRRAEACASERDLGTALNHLEALRSAYRALDPGLPDPQLRQSVRRAMFAARRMLDLAVTADERERVLGLIRWIEAHERSVGVSGPSGAGGQVVRIREDGPYGFIRNFAGQELFFHRSDLVDPDQWTALARPGTWVRFEGERTTKGFRAVAVALANEENDQPAVSSGDSQD